MLSFSGDTFVLLRFFCFVLRYHMHAPRQPHAVVTTFFFVLVLVFGSKYLFSSIFVPLPFFTLYGEYVVRFPLRFRMVFSTLCDHGLDF